MLRVQVQAHRRGLRRRRQMRVRAVGFAAGAVSANRACIARVVEGELELAADSAVAGMQRMLAVHARREEEKRRIRAEARRKVMDRRLVMAR